MPLSLPFLGGWPRPRPGAGPTAVERALRWLKTHSGPGGVLATTASQTVYPEVTGYTIPTLLALGERDLARQWGSALVALQRADGGIPGTDGQPYIFDTAQVMRGWLALLDDDPSLAGPTARAARWIVAQARPDGRLPASYGEAIPETVHLYALAPLREAARRLDVPGAEEAARRALAAYLQDDRLTAFTTLTHFLGYVLEGLVELDEAARARAGAEAVAAHQRRNGEVPGRADAGWVCTVGLAQLAVVWYRLHLDDAGDRAVAALERRQRPSGGFLGSHGRGASYFPREEISWGVKFFLDASLMRSGRFFARHADIFPLEVDAADGRVHALLDALKPAARGRILEVGCGRGRFLRALNAAYPEADLTGGDFAPDLLADLSKDIRAVEAGMLDLPFPDASFDGAYMVEALEHAFVPESAIHELCRVVRPGGPIIIIDKDRRALGRLQIVPWERWFDRAEVIGWLHEFCDDVTARPVPLGGEITSEGLFLAWSGVKRDVRLGPAGWSRVILPTQSPAEVAQQAASGSASRWARPILEVTRAGDVLLELGSGTGAMSAVLAQAGRRVILLDWSRDCVRFGREVVAALGGDARTVQADLLHALPLRDGSVDCVWSSGVLEHFTDDELLAVLRESTRVSRRLVVSLVPNAASIPYRIGKWHQERTGTWPWGKEEPKCSLRPAFEAVGLCVSREESVDVEHALAFLAMPEVAAFREMLRSWFATLSPQEKASLNQGYLLVTVGVKA
jgi:malonyl-CoA O-methyltransferase